MKRKTAIITGASSGMGADFARQIAAGGEVEEIWLVARRVDKLELLGKELSVPAVCIAADLATDAGISVVAEKMKKEQPDLRFFIMNAGYGKAGGFAELSLESQVGMVDLNVRALTALTHHAAPQLGQGSRVVLVASLGGFTPAASMAVYCATKAYVLSLGAALAAEWAAKGIHVTALCPGPVATEFFDVAGVDTTKASFGKPAASSVVVARTLRAVKRGKTVLVPKASWRVLAFFTRFIGRRALAGLSQKMLG